MDTSEFASRLWHGAAWYPELWPAQVEEDVRLMGLAGINLVRVGEFAWARMEPREGKVDLSWLASAMDACHAAGIGVMLCTPTATPPRWMSVKYPDILRVDADGRTFEHGSRQHVSHISATYQSFSRKITQALASSLGSHPALVAWQTDNEFLCHVDGDYSAEAKRAWHDWLANRYASVGRLNELWATGVWSETYDSFGDVPLPVKTPFTHHSSLLADWYRFISDTVVRFQAQQVEIIRKHSTAPITHNHIVFDKVHPESLYGGVDLAGNDVYIRYDQLHRVMRTFDLMRGAKMQPDGKTRPFLIVETAANQAGSRSVDGSPHPKGFLAAEAMLTLAMGANMVSYWPWRGQRGGSECCHGSVITPWGTPASAWDEVQEVSAMFAKCERVMHEYPPAEAQVAIHESSDARAILRAEPIWAGLNLWNTPIEEVHWPLVRLGYWRDVRYTSADVSRYRVVISPFMPAIDDAVMDRMEKFVEAGGLWIVGPMSGCRTEYATVHTSAGLGRLDAIAGVKTLYPFGLADGRGTWGEGTLPLGWHCFALDAASPGCQVLGRYLDGPAAGHAWCVSRTLGRGRIVLLGAHVPGGLGQVYDQLLREAGVQPLRSSEGTQVIPRGTGSRRAHVVVNWNGVEGWAELPGPGVDALTGKPIAAGRIRVAPFQRLWIVGPAGKP